MEVIYVLEWKWGSALGSTQLVLFGGRVAREPKT